MIELAKLGLIAVGGSDELLTQIKESDIGCMICRFEAPISIMGIAQALLAPWRDAIVDRRDQPLALL